jgi:hypothetical protein
MNHDLSLKTRRALKKYGYANCTEAHRLFEAAKGPFTIACMLQVSCLSSTQAVRAAIDAGRELHWAAKRSVQPSF